MPCNRCWKEETGSLRHQGNSGSTATQCWISGGCGSRKQGEPQPTGAREWPRRRERVRVTRALPQASRRTKSEGQKGGRAVRSSAVLGFERPLGSCLSPTLLWKRCCVGSSLTTQPLCASTHRGGPSSPQLQHGTCSSHLCEVQRPLFRS